MSSHSQRFSKDCVRPNTGKVGQIDAHQVFNGCLSRRNVNLYFLQFLFIEGVSRGCPAITCFFSYLIWSSLSFKFCPKYRKIRRFHSICLLYQFANCPQNKWGTTDPHNICRKHTEALMWSSTSGADRRMIRRSADKAASCLPANWSVYLYQLLPSCQSRQRLSHNFSALLQFDH